MPVNKRSCLQLLIAAACICSVACQRSVRIANAVRSGDRSSLERLVRNASEANTYTRAKWPIIVEAAFADNADMVHLLLQHGAQVNATNPNGFTALMEASKRGDLGVVEDLLSHGADVRAVESKLGWTALTFATFCGHDRVIDALVRRGAEVDKADTNGLTPLMWAIRRGQIEAVRQLLSHGANVNAHTSAGIPAAPILDAVDLGENGAAVVKLLLDNGANIETEGWQGETPLTRAARLGYWQVALLLISRGAKVNVVGGYYGKSPLAWAASSGQVPLVRALIQAGAYKDGVAGDLVICATCEALENGHLEALRVLLESGADVNGIDPSSKQTLLMKAAAQGNLDAIQMLLDFGAKPEITDSSGKTAAAIAADEQHTEAAALLQAELARKYKNRSR